MSRPPPHRSLAVAASLALVAGCTPDASDGSSWMGTVDTLANGAVHVASPAVGVWTPQTAWRLVEELRIGSLESDGPDLFGAVHECRARPNRSEA